MKNLKLKIVKYKTQVIYNCIKELANFVKIIYNMSRKTDAKEPQMRRVWTIVKKDDDEIKEYIQKCNISKLLAILSVARKVEIDELDNYLNPDIGRLENPFNICDMSKLVDRVILSKEKNEKITIYGDYDVDGVTSTVVMYDFLKNIGLNVDYYIPSRAEEGYGLNNIALNDIRQSGTSLVLTVDCGISGIEEVEYAKGIGIDMCITDHHECQESIPNCTAVVNPKRKEDRSNLKQLAGVGVAFKCVEAISKKLNMPKETYLKYLDIVAVGTIADIVELKGENRIIAKFGIDKLKKTENEGLKELIKISGIQNIDSSSVGFALAPRINASGRMAEAGLAVKLLLSKNSMEAYKYAKALDEQNKERQKVEEKIFAEVVQKIEKDNLDRGNSIVIAGEGWHQGVIGIVASKIVEKYLKPVILFTYDGLKASGSGRSKPGVSIYKALDGCKYLVNSFGGHDMAAGVTINVDKIDEFRNAFEIAVNEVTDKDIKDEIIIDSEIKTPNISLETLNEISKIMPFGQGNPEPIFVYKNAKVKGVSSLTDGRHLRIILEDRGISTSCIGFNMGDRRDEVTIGDKIDVVCTLLENNFQGVRSVQFRIKDFKKS